MNASDLIAAINLILMILFGIVQALLQYLSIESSDRKFIIELISNMYNFTVLNIGGVSLNIITLIIGFFIISLFISILIRTIKLTFADLLKGIIILTLCCVILFFLIVMFERISNIYIILIIFLVGIGSLIITLIQMHKEYGQNKTRRLDKTPRKSLRFKDI